jgi:adenosylmethionine-8-amino-7-oxononanoate aminotransferase
MLFYPPSVLAEMARICAAHGVLLIADEVMTGWGRTGTMLACDQAGVRPTSCALPRDHRGRCLWP